MTKKLIFALFATALIPAAQLSAQVGGKTVAITDAMIFDGTGAATVKGTVLLKDGRIAAVGPDVKIPKGAKVINAKGKALLPGFFDVHTHWTPSGSPTTTPQIATDYVRSGITTVADFHEQPESYAPRREWLSQLVAPHVAFAARISTPGGHGADWADQATTIWINTPEAANAAVESLKPYKPDLIKAFTDGWRYGMAPDNTSMDAWTLSALTKAANAQGWPVLTHTVTVERGLIAAQSGVNALAHDVQDRLATPDEVAIIAKSGMAVAPTLAVYDPSKFGPSKANDARYAQSVKKFGYALANVKAMFDAGVPIGVGTDAGMPGTPHGKSTLHEMELLVQAGLTPVQALVAGTQVSAKILKMDADRGTIAVGKRADVVLIDGKPWENISDVYKISQVFIDGNLVSGKGAPALPALNGKDRLPSVTVQPLVDDFERNDRRSSLDTLRLETPDGGMDRSVEITQTVPRDGGGNALLLSARMAMKSNAYAGFAIPLTRGSVVPVRVSAYKGIKFDIKGDGAYTLSVNGLDGAWTAPVTGDEKWTTVEVPFSALTSKPSPRGAAGAAFNGDGLTQIEFGGSRSAGQRLWLQIDNVQFY